jgi:hypothetical protein
MLRIFLLLLFISISILSVSGQEFDEFCPEKIEYVNRNFLTPPIIKLRVIEGRAISRYDGEPERLVCIALFSKKKRLIAQTIPNTKGYFSFKGIPRGEYILVARKQITSDGKEYIDIYCPLNQPIRRIKHKRKQTSANQELILNMGDKGIDDCSYAEEK